jgi:hypothetical protein
METVVGVALSAVMVLPVVALAIGAARGRVHVRSCCAVDVELDGRMRER